MVYALGGMPYSVAGGYTNSSEQVQLWGFEPETHGSLSWELQAIGSTATFPLDEVVSGALTASSPTNHYSLGGYSNSDGGGLDELISYNFTNQSWTNETTGQYYTFGHGQYIPAFGLEGVVVFFGGLWPANSGAAQDTAALSGFDTVLVYDIQSNTFFNPQQTTSSTGSSPLERMRFCSVGAGNGTGNSTYEM